MAIILKIKDKNNNWIDIDGTSGENAKMSFLNAKRSGFEGNEEVFRDYLKIAASLEVIALASNTKIGEVTADISDEKCTPLMKQKGDGKIFSKDGVKWEAI